MRRIVDALDRLTLVLGFCFVGLIGALDGMSIWTAVPAVFTGAAALSVTLARDRTDEIDVEEGVG